MDILLVLLAALGGFLQGKINNLFIGLLCAFPCYFIASVLLKKRGSQ